MTRRISLLTIFSLMLLAFMAMTVYAARTAEEARKVNPLIYKAQQYSFPDAQTSMQASGKALPRTALGGAYPSASPGHWVGDTYYDYQRNGSMRRMIESDVQLGGGKADEMLIHFSWMHLPGVFYTGVSRGMKYNNWDAVLGQFGTEVKLQGDDENAGYGGVTVTADGRAIVGCHNNLAPPEGPYHNQFYWDFGPGYSTFSITSRIPDSVSTWEGDQSEITETGAIWPAFAYSEGPGEFDTVLHVIAQESEPDAGDAQSIIYFRRVGSDKNLNAAWDYPPYVIDSVYDLAHDLDATDDGKVGLAWNANLPCPGGCDTCSGFECWSFIQWDNDCYYQLSDDYGRNFHPRVNITKNVDGEEGYRPYTDLSCLFDSYGDFHVVWNTMYWPADANQGGEAGLLKGRMFHVSSADTLAIRTVHNYMWDQTTCNGGAWNLNAAKMSISECHGKLYVLFTQFNDPEIGMEDCAFDGNPHFPGGAANGDLYVTISDDWGDTWDKARNLTNSHTPDCDSTGGDNGPCESDHWPSMTRFGVTFPSGDFPPNVVVTPTGSVDPLDYYLDVQYINDHSAGGSIQNDGFWGWSDVRWFRLPCVDPIRAADLYLTPTEIDYPSWSKHHVQHDSTLILENGGNDPLTYTLATEELTTPTGWLGVSKTSGGIGTGANNTDQLTVYINQGGIVNDPGTIKHLSGRVVVTWGGTTAPPQGPYDTLFIDHWVVDTLYKPIWDTVSTACTKLSVANTGNFGQQGIGKVNMDYVEGGPDCDTTADVYLYDGSPVVCYQSEGDLKCSFSIFSTSYIDTNGFRSVADHTPTTDMGEYEVFESGKFVTNDSLIAVEKVWYAPKGIADTCSFVIERIKVYLNDPASTPPTSVFIGEAIDWDIPADSDSRNSSGFDASYNLMWQRGCEEDTAGDCQAVDRRWGGIDFLDAYKNGVQYAEVEQHGAYTLDNFRYVYPHGDFAEDSLYKYMANSGYAPSDSMCSDLHMVMTFDTLATLTAADTFVFYVEIVSHWNGTLSDFLDEVRASRKWYCDHISPVPCGCCKNRGNADGIIGIGGPIDVADLTFLVKYLFKSGPVPPCLEEGNADGIVGIGGPIDVADLTYLVKYLFKSGPAPPPC